MFCETFKLSRDGARPFIQQMYNFKPHTTNDRKRYVEEVLLEAHHFSFTVRHLLKDARTRKLHNREMAVFDFSVAHEHAPIPGPGGLDIDRADSYERLSQPYLSETLAKLAKNVGESVTVQTISS